MLPVEIERRYFLHTLPSNFAQCRSVEIAQGYLSPFYDAEILEICRQARLNFKKSVTLRDLRNLVLGTPNKGFRVRKMGEQYFLTFKGRRDAGFTGSKRVEIETSETSSAQVKKLIFDTYYLQAKKIEKVRHYLPLPGGLTAEIDLFKKPFVGLMLAEVEFDSADAGESFVPPNFFGVPTQVSNRDLAYGKMPVLQD